MHPSHGGMLFLRITNQAVEKLEDARLAGVPYGFLHISSH
jgi:hypothetical protein